MNTLTTNSKLDPETAHATGKPADTGVDALRDDPMMAHLLDALASGTDIGHYGRLVFTMVARHFMDEDELVAQLTQDRDFSEEKARAEVAERDYNPPRRDRIVQSQAEQEFGILPDASDPACGNVYKSLRFPKHLYDGIEHYQEARHEAAA